MWDTPDEFKPTAWQLALEDAEHHVVGWDPTGTWCALFRIEYSYSSAELVAERDHALDEARALPLRKVVCHRDSEYLWAIDERSCTVWSRKTWVPLEEQGDTIKLLGTKLAKSDIVAVQSFSDDDNPGKHGIELALANGTHSYILAVTDGDRGAWAKDLAQTLATRWHLTYRHVTPGGYKPAWLREQAEHAKHTRGLIDGIVDAYNHYDDPDRVAAREAREAAKEQRDRALLGVWYVTSGQHRLAAWDRDDPTQLTIVVADRISDELLMRVVERRRVPVAEQAPLNGELRASGHAIGATYRRSLVYWVIDDALCAVFHERGDVCVLSRVADEVHLGERRIPLGEVRAVVAFAVPARYGHRGLALELASGEHVLVEEADDTRYDDKVKTTPGVGWNTVVAPELAAALGVPHRAVLADVITRPPPPVEPAYGALAACGTPVLAGTLDAAERARARIEGRIVKVWEFGSGGMHDSVSHAGFTILDAQQGLLEDADLVFEKPVPRDIDGRWDYWEHKSDVYAAFGITPPPD